MEVGKGSLSMERTSQTVILALVLVIIGSEILILHYKACKEHYKNATDNLINLNECYLVVHTLISDNYKNVTTYINSYTKPFMIELVNNATQDCICCPN
jgi:hypothetical protein